MPPLEVALRSDPNLMNVVGRAAGEYASRREALVGALRERGVEAIGTSGMNVWVPVPAEAPVLAATRDAGFALAAGERFRLVSGPGVRVSIGALQPRHVDPLAAAVAAGTGAAGIGSTGRRA